jgi:hypothetical protein
MIGPVKDLGEALDLTLEAGLFRQLPEGADARRLAEVEAATRERPGAHGGPWAWGDPAQQNAVVLQAEGVGRDPRDLAAR